MVWLVISTMSSFPSYHHLIKWLRVEREFWVYFMCGWPEGEFREFSPNWNKMGSPQQDHFGWGGIADAIKGGWHLLSWLNFTARLVHLLIYLLSIWAGGKGNERKREKGQTENSREQHPELPPSSLCVACIFINHWDTVKDGQRDPKNRRLKCFHSGEEAKEILEEIKIEYLSKRYQWSREILPKMPLT